MPALGPGVLALGATVLLEHDTRLDVRLQVERAGPAQPARVYREHHEQSTLTREADGFVVGWQRDHHVVDQPGHQHDQELPVSGHRYRVDARGVTRLDGALSEAERDIVAGVDLLTLLPTLRAMVPEGSTGPASPVFAALIEEAPGAGRLVEGTVTNRGWQPCGPAQCLVLGLDLLLESEGESAPGHEVWVQAHGTGELWLGEDGLARRFAVAGPVTVRATGPGLTTTGDGTFSVRTELTYR